jgi:acylphosphatase
MSERIARRFYVTGRVQGVFFRASTRHQAQQLNLTGHAVNLADGRVEVLAIGSADAVNSLQQWLWQGPPAAEVRDVQAQNVTLESVGTHSEFTTG